jgi:hypothetical protein
VEAQGTTEEKHIVSDETQTLEEASTSKKSSRRSMLRLAVPAAAGVAALAAAGATEVMRAPTARAANGDPVTIGSLSNSGANFTVLSMTSATGGIGAFEGVDESNAGQQSFGVAGVSFANAGVYGLSGRGLAVPGDDTDPTNKSFTGVFGEVYHDHGSSDIGSGYGVVAYSNRGAAPLLLQSFTGGTATDPGGFSKSAANGSMNVDPNGVLYSRRFGGWYGIPCMQFLPAPVRILDARTGASSGLVNRGALGPNEVYPLQIGGLAGIPTNCQGVFGNLTVLGPSGNGNISVYPDGASAGSTASMTFLTGNFLANHITSGVSSSTHKIDIQNQSSGVTPMVFDAVGFLI